MLRLAFAVVACAAVVFGADDPWAKVRDLKTGTELRIFKKGSPQPLLAQSSDLTDEKLIVIVKNEQTAIAKEDIDRIDYRPAQKGSRVQRETKSGPNTDIARVTGGPEECGPGRASVPGQSHSSSVTFVGKPDFETIYRRPPKQPVK